MPKANETVEEMIPTDINDLDAHTLGLLADYSVGDEVWVPVSTIYGNRFRAMKIQITEKVSVNNFEDFNAIERWDSENIHPTNHEVAEGIREFTK